MADIIFGAGDPISSPQDWDTVSIQGVECPGLCNLSGFKRKNEWDVKKGKGAVGSTITYVGRPPAKGVLLFDAWVSQHFADWISFGALFKYNPSVKVPQSVSIYHPALADPNVSITKIICESIDPWKHVGKGHYQRSVEVIEWLPPPTVSAVADATTTTTSGYVLTAPGKPPDPALTAAQAQFAASAGKVQALPGLFSK